MNRNVAAAVVSMLAALLVAGCGRGADSSDAEVDKALDEMKFEKAPTLGPILKKCLVATYKGDGAILWDNMSADARKSHQEGFEDAKKSLSGIDAQIKSAESALEAAPDEMERERLREKIAYLKETKEKVPGMTDAREYFIFITEHDAKAGREERKKKILERKMAVVGEEIVDGRTAHIKIKNIEGVEEKLEFVKEGDAWKLDAARALLP